MTNGSISFWEGTTTVPFVQVYPRPTVCPTPDEVRVGWVCPKCGRGKSPNVLTCECSEARWSFLPNTWTYPTVQNDVLMQDLWKWNWKLTSVNFQPPFYPPVNKLNAGTLGCQSTNN